MWRPCLTIGIVLCLMAVFGGYSTVTLAKSGPECKKSKDTIIKHRQAVFKKLQGAMSEHLKNRDLSVQMVRGQFLLRINSEKLFKPGELSVMKGARDMLRKLATALASVPGGRYQVAGHADSDGKPEQNWASSAAQASKISQLMIGYGMPPERISFAGYGQYQPIAPNDTPANRSMNRRIEIVLIPRLEDLLGR